jgi:hypothetical protein
MKTFEEYLNQPSDDIKGAWKQVETSWEQYLRNLHDHLRDNMGKYDAYHSKFGNLSSEHPDQYIDGIIKAIEKDFKKMKETLSKLGAHQMV